MRKKDNISKKHKVLLKLFEICESKNNYVFDNELIKEICKEVGFKNPFDVTKLDSIEKLPKEFIKKDIAIIHLGQGIHKFIKGINCVYHRFEEIKEEKRWKYKKSLLNLYNTSEGNILSVANNQRILHDFLFDVDLEFSDLSVEERPKTYFPHRTKLDLEYYVCNEYIKLKQVQVEIDLTIEYKGQVAVFEAKNGKPKNFSIYQIFHPYLYYIKAKEKGINIKDIKGVYLIKTKNRSNIELRLYAYRFKDEKRINSIFLEKARKYILEFS